MMFVIFTRVIPIQGHTHPDKCIRIVRTGTYNPHSTEGGQDIYLGEVVPGDPILTSKTSKGKGPE